MNTHDINLATEIWAAAQKGSGEGVEDAIERIVQIIEADRKRRGEPVAWIHVDELLRMHDDPRFCVVQNQTCLTCVQVHESQIPLYAAPVAAQPLIARPLAEWLDDDGPVMWWAWCGRAWAGEPAWCGTPNDSDWPGYHTHWTPHPAMPDAAIKER